MLRTTRNMLTE